MVGECGGSPQEEVQRDEVEGGDDRQPLEEEPARGRLGRVGATELDEVADALPCEVFQALSPLMSATRREV